MNYAFPWRMLRLVIIQILIKRDLVGQYVISEDSNDYPNKLIYRQRPITQVWHKAARLEGDNGGIN